MGTADLLKRLPQGLSFISRDELLGASREQLRAARRRVRRPLRPGEVALLSRYRPELSGDVLQIGPSGDGLTHWLAYNAGSLTGVGEGPALDLCRARYPLGYFMDQGGHIDLGFFADGEFSAVVAGRYALDRLGDEQRRAVLERVARILAPEGVLIFSSHNLACESLLRSPVREALHKPWRLGGLGRARRNRARLGPLQQRERGYALLNDAAEHYGTLSYFIARDGQDSQLREHDLSLLECVTLDDLPVGPGEHAYGRHELYYVAQPLAGIASRGSALDWL